MPIFKWEMADVLARQSDPFPVFIAEDLLLEGLTTLADLLADMGRKNQEVPGWVRLLCDGNPSIVLWFDWKEMWVFPTNLNELGPLLDESATQLYEESLKWMK